MGFLNTHMLDWDAEMLALAGLRPDMLGNWLNRNTA